ncbi:MAG: hypothetical protein Q7T58_10650 [Methylotenera sp.]|nr:hypothetical protein [Methylotenera sp.]
MLELNLKMPGWQATDRQRECAMLEARPLPLATPVRELSMPDNTYMRIWNQS